MGREEFISRFPNLQKTVGLKREDLTTWKGVNKKGYTNASPFAHLKDPSLAQYIADTLKVELKGPDGYIHGNYSGDLKDDAGRQAWVRTIARTVGGPVVFFQGRPQDNYGFRVDELDAPIFWLNKVETVWERKYGDENPREVAFLTTEQSVKEHKPGQINRGWTGKTQIERAVAVNEAGTHFEGRGVIIKAEEGEQIYDPSPFVDEEGRKQLLFVSKKGTYGEICVVTSANNKWDEGEWINRRTLLRPKDVFSHHDQDTYGPHDVEWNLENPRLSFITYGKKRYAVMSCTAFYPPPVERSFRQHGVVLVALSSQGPFKYGGVATTHTQSGLEDFRSGEAGALTQFYPSKEKYIAFQQSKAYGFPDVKHQPTGEAQYDFQGGYQHPSWQIEVLKVEQQALGLWAEALLHTLQLNRV
jgi:hypothetical protein